MTVNVHVIVLSEKGKEDFIFNGHDYLRIRQMLKDDSIKFWKSERRGQCNGRIHTQNDTVIKEIYLKEIYEHNY